MDSSRRACVLLALAVPVLLLLSFSSGASAQASGLKVGFYNFKCKKQNVETIVSNQVVASFRADSTICASLIRLHFHDCFVQGCDGSILLDFADPTLSEKNSPPNANSVRGYDVIDLAKAKLEAACPGVVSCTDVVALAARDCIRILKGVSYKVPTGRRDGTTSGGRSGPLQSLPATFHDIATLETIFGNLGLDTTDLVVLSGLHTVGRARCTTFFSRLWDTAGNAIQDPFLTPARSNELRTLCPFTGDRNVLVNMDTTPKVVDTVYFKQVVGNASVFQSDHALLDDPVTAAKVIALAKPKITRFPGVDVSMVKMGKIGVLTGTAGQIRRTCNAVNSAVAPAVAPATAA